MGIYVNISNASVDGGNTRSSVGFVYSEQILSGNNIITLNIKNKEFLKKIKLIGDLRKNIFLILIHVWYLNGCHKVIFFPIIELIDK